MLGTCKSPQKSAVWLLLFFILYKMNWKKAKHDGLIISKWFIESHYEKQFKQLKKMFGDNWFLYQYYTTYYLVVWECEMWFISMKWDFAWIVDWIEFGILCGKHSK